MIKLRPYQAETIAALRSKYANLKKLLLVAPTGSGKSVVMAEILRSVRDRGKRGLLVVRGRSLVAQASAGLDALDIQHGVFMSNHFRYRPHELISVCSIDTLFARKIAPPANFLCIDEAHLSQGAGYRWLIDQYPEAYFLSVTATPFLKKGLRHVADDFVSLTSMATLIEQGYLSPLKYYCPTVIDISGIKTNRGDYDEKELYKAVDKAPIYGDLVKSYRDYLPGKTALAFGVNVAHAKKIAAEFNASGIACGYVDANVDLAERNAIVERLKRRELYVISSVGTMTTGIDIPCLDGLIIARPTKSLNLHLQILGRASRVYPGKSHGIILDHAGNVIRLGLAEADRPINLDGFTPKEPEIPVITCEKCYSVFCPYQNHLAHFGEKKTNAKSRFYVCPSCGHNNQPKRSREEMAIENVNSEMREVTAEDLIIADYAALELLREKTKSKSGKKYHRNWSVYRLLTKYSETQINTALPEVLKAFHASKKHSS